MFVKRLKKWRQNDDRTVMLSYYYYRLYESYHDSKRGKPRQKVLMGLGDLIGINSEEDLKELDCLLTCIIEKSVYLISDNDVVSDNAEELYNRRRRGRPQKYTRPWDCPRKPIAI